MTISVNFSGQADQLPWVSSLFTQSLPNSSELRNGQVFTTQNPATNLISPVSGFNAGRSLSLSLSGPSYVAFATSSVASEYYLDYVDASNYLIVSFIQVTTTTFKLKVKLVVSGAETFSQDFGTYPESTFSAPSVSIEAQGAQSGTGYAVSLLFEGDTYSTTVPSFSPSGKPSINLARKSQSNFIRINSIELTGEVADADYTIRKGSTAVPITHTLTAAGITGATLNGAAVTLGAQSGQTVDISFTDTITTSGEYPLVLTDSAAATQTLTVQYNVYGLLSSTLKKDGVALGGLTGMDLIVMTGGGLPRTFLEQLNGITTDASGNTGNIVIVNQLPVPGEVVVVSLRSYAADIGIVYAPTLELL